MRTSSDTLPSRNIYRAPTTAAAAAAANQEKRQFAHARLTLRKQNVPPCFLFTSRRKGLSPRARCGCLYKERTRFAAFQCVWVFNSSFFCGAATNRYMSRRSWDDDLDDDKDDDPEDDGGVQVKCFSHYSLRTNRSPQFRFILVFSRSFLLHAAFPLSGIRWECR